MHSLWLDTHPVPAGGTEQFVSGTDYDTVVAGAGLTGLTTAVLLARAGQRVAVLEARSVGAAATGNTTAKLSLLQGTTLSQISRHQSDQVLRAYVEGNREGQSWLLRYLEERGVPFQRRRACTYATSPQGAEALRREQRAAETAGLSVTWTDETELPFPVTGSIVLEDQAQIHPMEVLDALATELREHGGTLIQGVRVTGAGIGSPLTVKTTHGEVQADHLVLATGAPVLDRGGYFAKLLPQRSYAQAYRIPGSPGSLPQGMYLSADAPSRSLRTAPLGDEELLLVGGNGHVVGRQESPQAAVDDLEAWTAEHFPGAQRTHSWSAQDYRSANLIPFVGTLPRGGGGIYLATGYNKWGMTNAVAAALSITAELLGGQIPWAATLGRRLTTPSDLLTGLKDTVAVGKEAATSWASAELHTLPDDPPAEGEGIVGRQGATPVGVSTVDGTTRKVSVVCPHLGGVLRWNDAECSWDCPLHGSRFSADGALLEGPAVRDLPTVPRSE
ncbi:FAD-dependent oxidoreductase [Citricoccus sp. NPDC079358]|uniref:Glycine/D-amino acid oxidase-like deaminating enzyme n=1 Tax=Citricoccus muralis TaxID=169134 RepID=A0A3D9LDS4_9MICC|nr:FAD-dependent oxidoreductase [Citricoccus muralis]REE04518.1 glycine/D-amino acid oxidase-like deaminating enzyme [Citricoccus muralis]